jgi:signal transduction histidine kinase
MWRSLRLKILISMIAITVLGIVITAMIASRSISGGFRAYSQLRFGRRGAPFVQILAGQYLQNDNWNDVQPLIQSLGQAMNERVLLVNSNGQVVGDSDSTMVGKNMADNTPMANSFPIVVNRSIIGRLIIDPFSVSSAQDTQFLASINHSVFLGTLVVVIIAVIVTIILSRTIIHPVEQLTSAAIQLEKGNLDTRVNVRSSDEVGKLAQAFNNMAETLSKLEELRRNMVSDIAHELRTPLSNIRGYLEAVKDGLVHPDKSLIENLYEETMILNRLVNDLQDLAQADAGYLRLEQQIQAVKPLIEAAVELSRPAMDAHKIELSLEIEPSLPPVYVDEQRITQVLRNLLNNAINYTPDHGKITISAIARENVVQFAVTDTGPGIAPDQLPLIFERFYRADPSRARSTGGSGLGLAIVKKLIDLHGGQVWAESQPGLGAKFFFTLPAAAQE